MIGKFTSGLFFIGVLLVLLSLLVSCATPATETQAPTTAPTEAPTAEADEGDEHEEGEELVGDLVQGGLLYDKWWVAVAAAEAAEHEHEGDEYGPSGEVPEGDHPLWATQSTNTRSGDDTWRCKECHGWDYKGVDGAYGSGSHMTGFPGVFTSQDKSVDEILAAMKGSTNSDHDFSAVMDEQALIDLSVFIANGLVDTDAFVNDDKSSAGDAAQGEVSYGEVCVLCHGPEGVAINFNGLDEPEYVTTVGYGNPWEFIHKVRFGQPGWPMPSAVVNEWTDADVANVLAYVQTLPEDGELNLGGQLYDKWWEIAGADEPTGDQPLWASQDTNTRSGTDTWRCKECHGWDYMGADGAYGSGSHFTGFPGVFGAAPQPEEELTAWLNGSANSDHDFSVMGDLAMAALVKFMREEMTDITAFIGDDKAVAGDAGLGKEMFENTCAACHGTDGKEINFGDEDDPEYVGTVGRDNPWEFLHKAGYGQPGAPMPSGFGLGWTLDDLANLAAYVQTLPTE
jgi:mono/diheme cytochrome c family protein/ribosomal protein L37AE/L43A